MKRFAVTWGRLCAISCLLLAAPVQAGSHSWRVNEIFSNADGTIQFIELKECCGSPSELGLNGKAVTSSGASYTFTANLSENTAGRHILLATAGFAALPGAPTPDHIIQDNFFSLDADRLQWHTYGASVLQFAAGQLPTDGVTSLNQDLSTGVNSPTNFARDTGSVSVTTPGPPAVPQGDGATMPMVVERDNAEVLVSWDQPVCDGASGFMLVYGEGSGLPQKLGGAYTLGGSVCGMGTSPLLWAAPEALDGSGLLWWVVLAHDGGTVEGSWGADSAGGERNGPGADGSSGECAMVEKDTSNTCE